MISYMYVIALLFHLLTVFSVKFGVNISNDEDVLYNNCWSGNEMNRCQLKKNCHNWPGNWQLFKLGRQFSNDHTDVLW